MRGRVVRTRTNNRPLRPTVAAPAEQPNSWEAILKRYRRRTSTTVRQRCRAKFERARKSEKRV